MTECDSYSPDNDNYQCDLEHGHELPHLHEVTWPGEMISRCTVKWGDLTAYQPKPGDRVTSPLLVGEWTVKMLVGGGTVRVHNGVASAWVMPDFLTRVAPPLPPEPTPVSREDQHACNYYHYFYKWTPSGTGSSLAGMYEFCVQVPDISRGDRMTRRQYLIIKAMMSGADIWTAIEAVSSTAIEHPEWDMKEEKEWNEWEGKNES